MRSSLLAALLLALSSQVQAFPGPPCPAPQLPKGSLSFSSTERRTLGPPATFTVRVDGQHLYWADGAGRLWRAPTSGGAPTSLVKERASNFLILGDTIYFTADKAIRKVPAAGGSSALVSSENEDPIELITDGRYLFYSMFDGSPVRQLETLYLDGPHVYWFDWTGGSGQHTLWRTLRAGQGRPERVQGGLCSPHHLAIDEGYLYIANKGAGTVLKIPKPK